MQHKYKYKSGYKYIKVEPDKEEEGELGAAVRRALGDGAKEAEKGGDNVEGGDNIGGGDNDGGGENN